ncbi:hypothetical protein ABPG72_002191 [Tetrahymena utriculariae]
MKHRQIRPQSAKLSFNSNSIIKETFKANRPSIIKKQNTFQKLDTKNTSIDESNYDQSPYTIGNQIKVRKTTKKESQILNKLLDTNRLSNPSLIQHSFSFLRTIRPQSGYTKSSIGESSTFYGSYKQDEWNFDEFQQTHKKDLYLDSFQLKNEYHQLQDDNLKLKSSIVKIEQKIGQMKRQIADFKVLQQFAEPSLKDLPNLSPQKKKLIENNHEINSLKREIKVQRDLIDQKVLEADEIKKMLRTSDMTELGLEKKILLDASQEYKEKYDKVQLQNKVGLLLQRNDYQQLEDIYQQKIRDLQKQNANLSSIHAKELEQTNKIKAKNNNLNQEVAQLRRQIQETEARIRIVKEENKTKKGKQETNKQASPQAPKDKVFIRQLEDEKQKILIEKISLQDQLNKESGIEQTKKQAIESSKNTYLNAIDQKKDENQDLKEQLHIIRQQNMELKYKLQEHEKAEIQENSENEEEGNTACEFIKLKSMNEVELNKNMNKNSSSNLNGNNRKNSINSQKSSDRDSLQYTHSKYGTSAQQKAISNFSPFQTTNIKSNLLSSFKNGSQEKVYLPEIYNGQNQDQEQFESSQKKNGEFQTQYPNLSSKKQQKQNQQPQNMQNNQLQDLPLNEQNLDQQTPKTSKRLEFFYSSDAQKINSQPQDQLDAPNSQPFVFNQDSMKQLKKKDLGLSNLNDYDQNKKLLNTDTKSNKSDRKLFDKKLNNLNEDRRQSENARSNSNFDDSLQSSAKNSTRQLSIFQRLSEQKKIRKISDMTASVYSNANVLEDSVESEASARENICYVDFERENFIDYLQKTIDLEKECSKFENLIQSKELLTFPNPQNTLTQIVFNQSTHNIVNNVFGFDSNCFNYDVRKQRIKSSIIIQDIILKYLEDQSTKKSFQIRQYEIHKIVYEKKRFDHSMMVPVTLGFSHILKQLSVNTIALPELSNSSFEFVSQFQIGNKEAYKAIIKRTSQSCTLISFSLETSFHIEMLLKEIELTNIIQSHYTLKPLCSYIDREDQKYYLNIIYIPLVGNLEDFLEKYEVQESERIKLCYQIALGIQDIHLHNYIHTQINPQNIMITENFTPLITSLKESSYLSEQKLEKDQNSKDNKQDKSNLSLTYQWILTKGSTLNQKNLFTNQDATGSYDFSFDIFSLGLIIYHILTSKEIPSEFNESSFANFDDLKKKLPSLDDLAMEQQIIIKLCLEKQTSIQGILYRLKQLIEKQDLDEIHNQEMSMKMLPQEQTPESQSEVFFEKGRLISQIENGIIDNVGMLFRTNNINLKGNNPNNRNTRADKKDEDLVVQMECLIGHFKGEQIHGKSIYIRQNEPYIQYMREQNGKNIYIFDSTTDELITCSLHKSYPSIKGELEESFLDKISDTLQSATHLVLPDKTELICNPKNHLIIIKKPGFGEIHYSPINIKYYLPNDEYILIENSKTYMYKSLNSSLNIVLPTSGCKEKIQLSSKEYFFEFINVNPYHIITLSKKNNEKQPVTAIFDSNFYLNTFLPAENSIKISTILINGGYLGFAINVKLNSVIFGVFKSPNETILLEGFIITSNSNQLLQHFDVKQQEKEYQSPLKSIKREFFSSYQN